ncbi:MAG: hypothetical protein H3Z54_04910 [archaeon]|nr:hypothetical protein [archaeon]
MNCKILALYLIFLMVLQASSISCLEVNEAEKPSYSIGDHWEYSVDDKKLMMERSLTKSVVNVTSDYYIIKVEGEGESSEYGITVKFTVDGELYLQKSDLSIVKENLKETEETTFGGGTPFVITEISNATYSPPLDEFDFPISEGNVWTENTTKTVTHQTIFDDVAPPPETTDINISRTYTCIKMENVTVPAGTFETFLINYTDSDGGYTEYYYSQEVGYYVKILSYDEYGLETEEVLTKYTYTPYTPPAPVDWKLYLAIGIVAIAIASISAIFIIRRKKTLAPAKTIS